MSPFSPKNFLSSFSYLKKYFLGIFSGGRFYVLFENVNLNKQVQENNNNNNKNNNNSNNKNNNITIVMIIILKRLRGPFIIIIIMMMMMMMMMVMMMMMMVVMAQVRRRQNPCQCPTGRMCMLFSCNARAWSAG